MDITRRGTFGVAAALAAGSAFARDQEAPAVFLTTYQSGDVEVATVLFTPGNTPGPMSGAGILLLHGGGGAQLDVERFYDHAVRWTERGYTVAMPNYFSGQQAGDEGLSATQRRIVVDGANWLASLSTVDPARVGAMGFSRGGYLACDIALTDSNIAAAVGVASGGRRRVEEIVRKPPVLLIYANRDPVVDPRDTRRWQRTLQEAGVAVDTVVLESPRHVFQPNEWRRVFEEAHDFFREHLAP